VSKDRALAGIKEQIEKMDPDRYRCRVPDPGVFVKWQDEKGDGDIKIIGSDQWDNVRDNAQAVAKYMKSKRAIERYKVKTPNSEWVNTTVPQVADDQSRKQSGGLFATLLGGGSTNEPKKSGETSALPVPTAETILGVEQGQPNEEIKRAFKRRAKELHPDNGGTPEQFMQLKEARDILLEND
jgi:hypothetical protein